MLCACVWWGPGGEHECQFHTVHIRYDEYSWLGCLVYSAIMLYLVIRFKNVYWNNFGNYYHTVILSWGQKVGWEIWIHKETQILESQASLRPAFSISLNQMLLKTLCHLVLWSSMCLVETRYAGRLLGWDGFYLCFILKKILSKNKTSPCSECVLFWSPGLWSSSDLWFLTPPYYFLIKFSSN